MSRDVKQRATKKQRRTLSQPHHGDNSGCRILRQFFRKYYKVAFGLWGGYSKIHYIPETEGYYRSEEAFGPVMQMASGSQQRRSGNFFYRQRYHIYYRHHFPNLLLLTALHNLNLYQPPRRIIAPRQRAWHSRSKWRWYC